LKIFLPKGATHGEEPDILANFNAWHSALPTSSNLSSWESSFEKMESSGGQPSNKNAFDE